MLGGGSLLENCLIHGRGGGDDNETRWAALVIGTENGGTTFEISSCTFDDVVAGQFIYVQYDDTDAPISLYVSNSIFSGRGRGPT